MVKVLMFLIISVAWVQSKKYELVSPPQDIVERLMKIGETCIAESGAEADIFDKFIKGTYSNNLSTKKFMNCYLEKGGYVDSEGYFSKEMILAIIGPHEQADQMGKMLDQCNIGVRKANYQDKYEKSYALMQCLHANTPLKLKLD